MSGDTLVKVSSGGLLASACAAWRLRGNTRATVIVKAELSFADGELQQVAASPVDPETEMAFVLNHAEVLFSGLVFAKAPARIAVMRGDEALLEHTIASPPAGGAAIGGRLSPFSPERNQHLNGFSPTGFKQRFVQLPDAFDSMFFQSAPPEQHLSSLAGGDAIVLENLYPGHPKLVLHLPTVHVSGQGKMAERTVPIKLRFDTAFVDAASHRCTLLWRGRIAATNEAALARASASVEATVTVPGRVEGNPSTPWPGASPSASSPFDGTVVLSSDAVAAATVAAQTASPFEGTVALAADVVAAATKRPSTPFKGAPPSPVKPADDGDREAIPGAPWAATSEVVVSERSPAPAEREQRTTAPPVMSAEEAAELAAREEEERKAKEELARAEEAEKARRAAEKAEEEERKAQELAAAEARRREEAERFAKEQAAAQKAEAERIEKKKLEAKAKAKKVRSNMYGDFKKK